MRVRRVAATRISGNKLHGLSGLHRFMSAVHSMDVKLQSSLKFL
jgi:hypothetical protein